MGSIDLAKFFDNLDVGQVIALAKELGMPEGVTGCLESFYGQVVVMFKARGVLGGEWVKRRRGVLQGCALSCILAALVMAVWVKEVKAQTEARPRVFVDDRILTADTEEELKKAMEVTRQFDDLTGGKWNAKGRLCGVSEGLGERYGIAVTEGFTFVGHHFDVGGREQTSRRNLQKVVEQLERIAKATGSRARRRRLVTTLIRPKLRFAAALNGYGDKDVKRIELAIERCVMHNKLWVGRSVTAQWLLNIGVSNHPGFIRDCEAVEFRRRRLRKIAHIGFTRRQKARRETAGDGDVAQASEGGEGPQEMEGVATGRLQEVCKEWGWKKVSESTFELPGGAVLDLARDGHKVIERAAMEGWAQAQLAKESRGGISPLTWQRYKAAHRRRGLPRTPNRAEG